MMKRANVLMKYLCMSYKPNLADIRILHPDAVSPKCKVGSNLRPLLIKKNYSKLSDYSRLQQIVRSPDNANLLTGLEPDKR